MWMRCVTETHYLQKVWPCFQQLPGEEWEQSDRKWSTNDKLRPNRLSFSFSQIIKELLQSPPSSFWLQNKSRVLKVKRAVKQGNMLRQVPKPRVLDAKCPTSTLVKSSGEKPHWRGFIIVSAHMKQLLGTNSCTFRLFLHELKLFNKHKSSGFCKLKKYGEKIDLPQFFPA